jgi:hypothetical protein
MNLNDSILIQAVKTNRQTNQTTANRKTDYEKHHSKKGSKNRQM